MTYYIILGIVILAYVFATGYWVAQDRYYKQIHNLQRENLQLRAHLLQWRFPHAPNS